MRRWFGAEWMIEKVWEEKTDEVPDNGRDSVSIDRYSNRRHGGL